MRAKRDDEIQNREHDIQSIYHPPNCECLRLHPGLFLPASLVTEAKDENVFEYDADNTMDNDKS